MTNQEFSNEFDILYNNIMSNAAPGINEYEKSVFLTKAQKQVIRAYFEPSQNKSMKGFDSSEKRQYDFGSLMSTATLSRYDEELYGELNKLDSRSIAYVVPSDLFLAINESAMDDSGRIYSILPISYQEYNRLMLRPYNYPPKKQVWRLITSSVNFNNGFGYTRTSNNGYASAYSVYNKPITIRVVSTTGTLNPTENNNYAPVVTEYDDYVDIYMRVPNEAAGSQSPMVYYWNIYLLNTGVLNLDDMYKEAGVGWEDSEGNLIAGSKYVTPFTANNGGGSWPSNIEALPFTINVAPASPFKLVPVYEVIGRFSGTPEYKLRYVRTPKPIILVNLNDIDEALSIDGVSTISECELPVETHEEILQRAVELAKAAYSGDLQSQLALGVNSETNIGMVQTSK